MLRLLLLLVALGFLSAMIGCHAEVGGGVGETSVLPAR